MMTNHTTATSARLRCKVCMKEISVSEAIVPEATDYVAHFCGVKCYDKWRKQPDSPDALNKVPMH